MVLKLRRMQREKEIQAASSPNEKFILLLEQYKENLQVSNMMLHHLASQSELDIDCFVHTVDLDKFEEIARKLFIKINGLKIDTNDISFF